MARKNIAVAAFVSAAVLLLSGCATGFDAATNAQGDSGNGRSTDVGSLQIRNATVVADPEDPTRATVLMTVINTDEAADDRNFALQRLREGMADFEGIVRNVSRRCTPIV